MKKKEVKQSKVKVTCIKCKKIIKEQEKYVCLTTHSQNKITEKACFHFKCWGDYIKDILEVEMTKKTQQALLAVRNMLNTSLPI